MSAPAVGVSPEAAAAAGMSAMQAARQTDEQLGITKYVGSHEGFSGTMKYRFTDFIVREVGLDKKVVVLSDLRPDSADRQDTAASSTPGAEGEQEEDREAILKLAIGDEQAEKVLKLEASLKDIAKSDPAAKDLAVILSPETDKAKRTAVHQTIRKFFPLLNTDSVKVEEETCVRVFSTTHLGDAFQRGGDRSGGPPKKKQKGAGGKALYQGVRGLPPGKKFCAFTLFKENLDTMTCISLLAKLCNTGTKSFGYAGTKDRRAATVQRVTAMGIPAGKLANLNLRFGAVGDFEYVDSPLKLGDLSGNRFSIVLRDISASDELVSSSCTSLSQNGFINYYGKQRFGSTAIGTHAIGLAMLKSDWAEATRLILCPRAGEKEDANNARKKWEESGNVGEALRSFPHWMHVERSLLEGFKRHGKDSHKEALNSVTRNMRLMYVHAWQSGVFNRMASERVERYGCLKAVEGDLVLESGEEDTAAGEDAEVAKGEGGGDDKVGGGGGGGGGEGGGDGKEGGAWSSAHPKKVKVLSKEEADRTSIFDVVLPLPGMSVEYPQNDMRAAYEAVVKEAGLEIHDMRHTVKDYQLQGDYRRLISRPEDLKWSIITYNMPRADLVATDLDVLRGRTDEDVQQAARVEGKGEDRRALKIEFTLKSSNYATMCLREILKEFTEASSFGLANAPPPPPPQQAPPQDSATPQPEAAAEVVFW